MSVSAIVVTRGDVDLEPIVATFPRGWQVLVWNNGTGELREHQVEPSPQWITLASGLPDIAVYGRYAALDYARHEVVYVQDDDCIVADPAVIASTSATLRFGDGSQVDAVVCNMPQQFRHDFYEEHALSGFGCAFPRSLPGRTFVWFRDRVQLEEEIFNRTCDIVFTGLTQRILVDIPVRSLDYASDPNRMWKQPTHQSERSKVLGIVKELATETSRPLREVPGK